MFFSSVRFNTFERPLVKRLKKLNHEKITIDHIYTFYHNRAVL